jgi:hypothetical protein
MAQACLDPRLRGDDLRVARKLSMQEARRSTLGCKHIANQLAAAFDERG